MDEKAERRAKTLGLQKLFDENGKFRLGKFLLDGTGHFFIAFGAALLVALPAKLRGWSAGRCAWVGALVGFAAMLIREVVQLATTGSLHAIDRLVDLAPAAPGGAVAGLVVWGALRLWDRRRKA